MLTTNTVIRCNSHCIEQRRSLFKSCMGFTLIEILVSVSIIAIALLAVNKLYSRTITMANSVKFYTKAPLLAQSKMSEADLKSQTELMDDSGDFGEDYPGYSWKITVGDVESDLLEQTAVHLKQVDVDVFYNTDEYEFSLRQYLFVRE